MIAVNSKADTIRTCIQTAHQADKSQLVRFVRTPDGGVLADLTGKLPGRGAYIQPQKQTIEKAVKSGKLKHHLSKNSGPVTIDTEQLFLHLSRQINAQFLANLTLLRRAGRLVIGRTKLVEAQNYLGMLIADDASERETQAMLSKTVPLWVEKDIPSELLGKTAGRQSIAYAGVDLGQNVSDDENSNNQDKMVRSLRAIISLWRECGVLPDQDSVEEKLK